MEILMGNSKNDHVTSVYRRVTEYEIHFKLPKHGRFFPNCQLRPPVETDGEASAEGVIMTTLGFCWDRTIYCACNHVLHGYR